MPLPANVSSNNFDFCNALIGGLDQVVFAYQAGSNQLLYLNPYFEQVFGLKQESLTLPGILTLKQALLQLVLPEDHSYVREVYENLIRGEIKTQIEFRFLLPDQRVRWLQVKPFLLQQGDKQIIAGIADDITDFKHYAEVEQKYANKKNAILQILSHDLAGPLGIIQSLSSLIATRINPYKDEDLNHVIKLITDASKGGLNLIRDFVEAEFLESAEMALIKSRVNIVEKLQEVVKQFGQTLHTNTKKFPFVCSAHSIYIQIDSVKFMQVITNLISNALKFTKEDGIITIGVEDKQKEGKVLITVADNGIGIPEKYHPTLFDKFTKARRPGLKNEPSVGLGMSVIKTIVEWHQGRIWFESEENKGTAFYIEIPKN